MNNYPGSSRPRLSSPMFTPFSRQQILQSEISFKSSRLHPYDSNDRFHRNTEFSGERRMSLTNRNFPLSGDGYDGSSNSDLLFHRRDTNPRLYRNEEDYRNEGEYIRSQRFSPIDGRTHLPIIREPPLHAETYRSQGMDLNYPRRTFIDERNPSIRNYSDMDRLRLNQRLDFENELRLQREQPFNRFPPVNNSECDTFPPMRTRSPLTDYSESNSLREQPLNHDRLYDDIPSSSNRPGLTREEEVLTEIRLLQRRQKLQKLLDASIENAERLKSSEVLGNVNKESLSNNTSSSVPDTFIRKVNSDEGTADKKLDCDIISKNITPLPPKSSLNDADELPLNKMCNSSILDSKSESQHVESVKDSVLPSSLPNNLVPENSNKSNDYMESGKESVFTTSSTSDSILESHINVSNSSDMIAQKENSSSINFSQTSVLDSSISVSNTIESNHLPENENVSASSTSSLTTASDSKIVLPPDSPKQNALNTFDSTGNIELNKVLNLSPTSNSSASEWPKSFAIPFLGDTTEVLNGSSSFSQESTEPQESKTDLNIAAIFSQSDSGDSKEPIKSVLEDALKTLEIVEPVVGLDYIFENKSNISDDGSFSFYCQLCNSSIARPMIINHVLSYKHRMRYVKIKDEDTYEDIMRYKANQFEKEEEIYKASEMLEEKYGRGHVVLKEDFSSTDVKKKSPITISFKKVLDSPKPTACEHNDDFELEPRKVTSIILEGSTNTPDDKDVASPVKASLTTPLLSQKKMDVEIPKQVSPTKLEVTNVSDKNKPLIITSSPLKTIVEETDSDLNPPLKWNDAVYSSSLLSMKRPLSPQSLLQKRIKTDDTSSDKKELESLSNDSTLHKDLDLKDSTCVSQTLLTAEEEKVSLTSILQHMMNFQISSSEEAEMISKTVQVLLKLLLRYKLGQEPKDEEKKLMQSFLTSHLDKPLTSSYIQENIVVNKESTFNNAVQDTSPTTTEVMDSDNKEPNLARSLEQSATQVIPTTTSVPDVSSSKPSSNPSLQPPPFFCFPNSSTKPSSTVTTSQSNVVTTATNWNSQYTAPLYPYQQQGYLGVSPMYQPYTLPASHLGSGIVPPLQNIPPLVPTVAGPHPIGGVPPLPPSTGVPLLPPSGASMVVPLPVGGVALPPVPPSRSGLQMPPHGPAVPPSTSAKPPLMPFPSPSMASGSAKPGLLPYPGSRALLATPPQSNIGGPPKPPPLPPSGPMPPPPLHLPPPPPPVDSPPKPPLPP